MDSTPPPGSIGMNVIWIVADTFRQDHLGAYGKAEIQDAGPGRAGCEVHAVRAALRSRIPHHAHAGGPRHGAGGRCRSWAGSRYPTRPRRSPSCSPAKERPHRRDGRHAVLPARRDELRQGLPDVLDVHGPGGVGDRASSRPTATNRGTRGRPGGSRLTGTWPRR